MEPYTIPAHTRIGHVHLKVSDLERSLEFYRDLLGFEVTMYYGSQAAFISAGGYHHHIGLNTWHSKGSPDDGLLAMFTGPLDLTDLLKDLDD
jgi:catechol 2,3-dioxygenase